MIVAIGGIVTIGGIVPIVAIVPIGLREIVIIKKTIKNWNMAIKSITEGMTAEQVSGLLDGNFAEVQKGVNEAKGAVGTEELRAKAAEEANAEAIGAEVERAEAAEAAEAERAQAAERALDGRITEVQQGSNAAIEALAQYAGEIDGNVAAEKERAQEAELENRQKIEAEVTRAKGAEEANAEAIGDEVARAQAAEASLTEDIGVISGDLEKEIQRAQAAEAAEAERAQEAEQALGTEITEAENRVDERVTEVRDSLEEEVQARNVAVADLNANTGISEYPAFDPAVDYAVGDVVNYEGRLRRFVAEHAAGEWIGTDVEDANSQSLMDMTIINAFGYTFSENIIFTGNYQWHKLIKPIKQGQIINISGDITKLNFYVKKTSESGNNIEIASGDVAPVDLYWVRSITTVGKCRISVKSLRDDFINVRVTQSMSKNLLDPSAVNIDSYDNNTTIKLPYLILRDKSKTKITVSKRNANYNLHIAFINKERYKIHQAVVTSGNSIDIPNDCEYIQFIDYVAELKVGTSMVNYGEEVLEYEPFVDICSTGLHKGIIANKNATETNAKNISSEVTRATAAESVIDAKTPTLFTETIEFTAKYQAKKLTHPIKAGQTIIFDGLDSLNAYGKAGTISGRNLTLSSGDVAPFDIYWLRCLTATGTVTVNASERLSIIRHSNSANLFLPYIPDSGMLERLAGTTSIVLPSLIRRDKLQTKLTASVRKSAYNIIVGFVDKDMNLLATPSGFSVGTSIDIPDDCEYIFFKDYIAVIKANVLTMVNYGEEVLEYEPFVGVEDIAIHQEVKNVEEKVKTVEEKVDKFGLSSELVVNEPLVLSSTKENLVYVKDMLNNTEEKRVSLVNTHYNYAGGIGYVNKPSVGEKTGYITVANEREVTNYWNYKTKSVSVPSISSISILDIGSSYIDLMAITRRQKSNFENDGISVNQIGTMGIDGARHEARSGGTWDFLIKPLGRAVILDVSGVSSLPVTGYPGTTYQDANGIKWTVRGVMISNGVGKLVLSSFAVDINYGGTEGDNSTDYDIAAENMPTSGVLTKTTNDSTGISTSAGDSSIQYSSKELVYYNPFWNPSTNQLDFVYYINKWGFEAPDIITLTFGSNDLGNGSLRDDDTVSNVTDKAVQVVDRIHEQYPNCKVIITTSCYGYDGASAKEFQVPIRAYNLKKYYSSLVNKLGISTKYNSYVRVVPTLCMIDRNNGFNASDIKPCSLYDITMKVSSDMVHPNTNGFYQFADGMLGYEYELLGLQ